MNQRSRLRLVVLQVLVLSLMLTLAGRLYYLDVLAGGQYQQAAADNQTRQVLTEPVRGLILDDQGTALVANRSSIVVTVDRSALAKQKDGGRAVVARLAAVLHTTATSLEQHIALCGTPGAPKPPVCWNGSPYQPIPVAKDVADSVALQIIDRSELFPGVAAQPDSVRAYPAPDGANAAQLLGYLGPVTQAELNDVKDKRNLQGTDTVGRAGLEEEYDQYLRGVDGIQTLSVDHSGAVTGTVSQTAAVPGDDVVTNINAPLQALVEKQLDAAITRARSMHDTTSSVGGNYKADSGAMIVLQPNTGKVLAMASYPTYNPSVWVGGISQAEYDALTAPSANQPMVSRAMSGGYAPASTFKVISTSAALQSGFASPSTQFDCSSSFKVGTQLFTNDESSSAGNINLARALEISCDTVFYRVAYQMWLNDGGNNPKPKPGDYIIKMAQAYGLGKYTGIDVPGETEGLIASRQYKTQYWEQNKTFLCAAGKGLVKGQTAYQRAVAAENCVDGYQYRGGDAVNFAIGQGDTSVTPLQMARVYAAIANGGTLYQPEVASAILSATGKVVQQIAPVDQGKLPVSSSVLNYIRAALLQTAVSGTTAIPFKGFPLAQIPIASKTGTGQVAGKQTTAWVDSYASANGQSYVVICMVTQGGTGSGTCGPSVRKVYESLYGVTGSTVDPSKSIIKGGVPTKPPTIQPDGVIKAPVLTASGGAANGGGASAASFEPATDERSRNVFIGKT